jgi:hypothetical protein
MSQAGAELAKVTQLIQSVAECARDSAEINEHDAMD